MCKSCPMKITFTFLIVLFLFIGTTLQAQNCGYFDTTICANTTPPVQQGILPLTDNIPCIVRNVPYETVLTLQVPDSIYNPFFTTAVEWVKVHEINNLPCGLCWHSSVENDSVEGGRNMCIKLSGQSADSYGKYLMSVMFEMKLAVFTNPILISYEDLNWPAIYLRLKQPAAGCTSVNFSNLPEMVTDTGFIVQPTLTYNGNISICDGDTTRLMASPGYEKYLWSTGDSVSLITVDAPGVYTVTVTRLCTNVTLSITVQNNRAVALNSSGPLALCNGDSLTLSVDTAQSSYLWNTGDTSSFIIADTQGYYYASYVDSNGCYYISDTVFLSFNDSTLPIDLSLNDTLIFCSYPQANVSAPLGYQGYSWNTVSTNAFCLIDSTGYYKVTVSQGTCIGTDSVFVLVKPSPVPQFSVDTMFNCSDDIFDVNIAPGYDSYNWSSGNIGVSNFFTTLPGEYWVTVTQNGCSGVSDTLTLVYLPQITSQIYLEGWNIQSMYIYVISVPGATYQWLNNNVEMVGAVNDTLPLTFWDWGEYRCMITVGNCSTLSDPFYFAFEDVNDVAYAGIVLYPNPTSNTLFINSENVIDAIRVTDGLGRLVHRQYVNTSQHGIDVSAWPAGLYSIEISSGNSSVVEKILVKH